MPARFGRPARGGAGKRIGTDPRCKSVPMHDCGMRYFAAFALFDTGVA
jgi:hypothetical protein